MANYKKSFNFRHGVQVDNDNFIVNANGLVGIGTSIPKHFLDVKGNAAVTGVVTSSHLYADDGLFVGGITTCGFTTITDDMYVAGVITATTFHGDGRLLSGVVSISTDGFIKVPVGLHTSDSIGIGSTPSTTDKLFVYSGGQSNVSIAGTANGNISGASLNLQNRSPAPNDYTEINGINGAGNSISAIRFYSESNTFNSGYLTLLTRPIGGAIGERIRITSDGKVGIGTTNPIGLLDVDGDVSFKGSGGISSISWDKSNNRLEFKDGVKATFGNSEDLEIYHYHDGANIIKCTQVGQDLNIATEQGEVYVQTDYASKNAIACYNSAGVKIYYDNSSKFETLSIGATVTGDFGVSNDVLISGVTTCLGSFEGNLTGTATTSTVAIALTDSPDITISNLVGAAATVDSFNVTNKSFTVLSTRRVGIGTTIPTSDLQIISTNDSLLEVITDSTNSRISIGNSVGLGNSSTALRFNDRNFEISNYDYGNVVINLHTGDGNVASGVETGGFKVNHVIGGDIFKLTYDGKLGVNRSGFELEDHHLEVGGNVHIEGDGVVTGIFTAGTGQNKVVLGDGSSIPTPTSQNFYSIVGISTFNDFNITRNFITGDPNVSSAATIRGQVFLGETDGNVGIGTSGKGDWNEAYSHKVFGSLITTGDLTSRTKFGLLKPNHSPYGDFHLDPRVLEAPPAPSPNSMTLPPLDYGNFQIESDTGATLMCGQSLLIVPSIGITTVGFGSTSGGVKPRTGQNTKVGINTYFPRGVLDLGVETPRIDTTHPLENSLFGNDLAYLVLPSVTQFSLNDIATSWDTGSIGIATRVIPDGIPQGSLLFNSTTSRLEVGIGTTTFCGIATLTNQHVVSTDLDSPNRGKFLSAFVPPAMTGLDRLRLTNAGISSGAMIYNTNDDCIQFYNGSSWISLNG